MRSLLTMSDGLEVSSDFFRVVGHGLDRDPYRYILGTRLTREPGVAFEYNNATRSLSSSPAKRLTGKTVDVLAMEDIFTPLGIESVDWKPRLATDTQWQIQGRPAPARLGENRSTGIERRAWEGKQIVSSPG